MSEIFAQVESAFEELQNTEFKWTHSSTWLLIKCYLDMKDAFRDPHINKKELWIRISEKFRKLGYEVPFDLLDKRFRDLKAAYFQLKEKKQLSPSKLIKWEYYKCFDELMLGDEVVANSATASTSPSTNDPRLSNIRSKVYVPVIAISIGNPEAFGLHESRQRKRSITSSKSNGNGKVKFVTIEPAVSADFIDGIPIDLTRRETNLELNINDAIIEDSQDGRDENDAPKSYDNTNSKSFGKILNLGNLEARKLQAETRYFNKKADYFEKQTMCLDVHRKLMIMQAHKLKLEIERMKADTH